MAIGLVEYEMAILCVKNKSKCSRYLNSRQNKADRHKSRAPSYQQPMEKRTDGPMDGPTDQWMG